MRRSSVCRSLMRPSAAVECDRSRGSFLRCLLPSRQRIIILRHAEKLNAHELCAVGAERAQALAKQFLGRGAAHSLFRDQDAPAAFLAITLHTIETISPVAQTWGLPVTAYTHLAR